MGEATIRADTLTIRELFTGRRFRTTYYQREYSWTRRDVTILLTDLRDQFLRERSDLDDVEAVLHYPQYYLGSIVYYTSGPYTYVVDGQQRITTIHLLLLYLRRLLREHGLPIDDIDALIRRGEDGTAFVVDVKEHAPIYAALLEGGPVRLRPQARPSEQALVDRSRDIDEHFPADLRGAALPAFVAWLLGRVCVVAIRAVNSDHGWRIFETTNDRGVRLGPVDLLKGHLLTRAEGAHVRLNTKWREMLSQLSADPSGPSSFIKSYLLAKHVALDDDADRARARDTFHEWVRENHERLGITEPGGVVRFVERDLVPLGKRYSVAMAAAHEWNAGLAALYYNEHNQIPHHLAAVLAPALPTDTEAVFVRKARLVANYLDLLYVRRLLNGRITAASDLEEEILALIGRLRTVGDEAALAALLAHEVATMGDDVAAAAAFGLTESNVRQVRYLLARLTSYVEVAVGRPDRFAEYVAGSPPYEVAHIASYEDYHAHPHEWGDRSTFEVYRSQLGSLLLLPPHLAHAEKLPFGDRLALYRLGPVLAAALHPASQRDTALQRWLAESGLAQHVTPLSQASLREGLVDRRLLTEKLCRLIWNPEALGFPAAAASAASAGASAVGRASSVLAPAVSGVGAPMQPTARQPETGPPGAGQPEPGSVAVGDGQATSSEGRVASGEARSAVVKPRRRGRVGPIALKPLIEAGQMDPGDILVGRSGEQEYLAVVLADGRIRVNGRIYPNPDAAAAAVLGKRSFDGYAFWHIKGRDGDEVPLSKIRKEAKEAGYLS